MASRGFNVVSGLQRLGNTVRGLDHHHMRLLYKICVVPVLTYGCQLWYRPDNPKKGHISKLQKLQNEALRRIAGAFRTTQRDPPPPLFRPPYLIMVRALHDSVSARFFQLPLSSETLSSRLPSMYLPPRPKLPVPSRVLFKRPIVNKTSLHNSPPVLMAPKLDPETERANPFHSHNAPYSFSQSSPPFVGRLIFDSDPCPASDRRSLVSTHNRFFHTTCSRPNTLVVFTDGSRRDSGTGYAIVGYNQGNIVFQSSVPFAKQASSHDAEMYALARASVKIHQWVGKHPRTDSVRIFSDCSSAIKTIFDGGPHPAQDASILFRSKFFDLFSKFPSIKARISWTPGHKPSMAGTDKVDKMARKAAKSKKQPPPRLR